MNHASPSPITRSRIATRLSWLLAAATGALARAEFVPGHIYITHAGNPDFCGWAGYPPTDRVYDVDPATGNYTLLKTKFTCRNLSSGIFTPDGSAMLAARSSANEVIRIQPDGTSQTVLTGADGLSNPGGRNGMVYGNDGSLFLVNNGTRRIWRFPNGSAPGSQFGITPGTGAIAKAASGDIYWAGTTNVDPFEMGRVYRFTDEGVRIEFDRFVGGLISVAADGFGNLFVLGPHTTGGTIWRYQNEDPSTRQVLVTGLSASGALTMSGDGTTLYAAVGKWVYSIDIDTGAQALVTELPDMTHILGVSTFVPESTSSAMTLLAFCVAFTWRARARPTQDNYFETKVR
ncbi:hypothetical protein RAS1_36240 [Phycisphaerae bacterium RAS1]|nr:hypothetical protein RAS1_36240 [Phycisphaerae bacterium RAS1]